MKKKVHDKLQKSIDKMQEVQGIMRDAVISLCDRLGRIAGYEFEAKDECRLYVDDNGNKYDFDELIKCADKYI